MKPRTITVLGISPQHPRTGDSYITLDLVLEYLKGQPVEQIEISPYVARKLAEEGIVAARIVENTNTERRNRNALTK